MDTKVISWDASNTDAGKQSTDIEGASHPGCCGQ